MPGARLYDRVLAVLERGTLPCPTKALTGVDCPGCGSQRAALAALRGEWGDAFALYPPGIFLFVLVIFTALHLRFRWPWGARVVLVLFILAVAAILGSFVWKMVTRR